MAALIARRPRTALVITAGLVFAMVGCTPTDSSSEPGTVIDLLQEDWQNMPGLAADDDGVRVGATARSIVEQDGGEVSRIRR